MKEKGKNKSTEFTQRLLASKSNRVNPLPTMLAKVFRGVKIWHNLLQQ